MPDTLLLLAEAAIFLLCLFVYLRVHQVLQNIQNERIAWKSTLNNMDEVLGLLEQLQEMSPSLDLNDVETRLSHLEAVLQGEEPSRLSFALPDEEEQIRGALSPLCDDCRVENERRPASPIGGFAMRRHSSVTLQSAEKYETVLQLAESGWDSMEIAQHTHLGSEEVQMIINLWIRGRGN